jgi:hypothetical protein
MVAWLALLTHMARMIDSLRVRDFMSPPFDIFARLSSRNRKQALRPIVKTKQIQTVT